ncbi:esterase-like activity of phytase family protein [Pararhizobium mangrovi]|nr:esterase-like activity of phytase family protein [Pararhizobium mangrovi]
MFARRPNAFPAAAICAVLCGAAFVCAPHAARSADKEQRAEFLGAIVLPDAAEDADTRIGGLSGITYDATEGDWLFVSDDKNEYGPPRLYRARVLMDHGHLAGVRFTDVLELESADNGWISDMEAVASEGGTLLVTTEGNWPEHEQNRVLAISPKGAVGKSLPLPESLKIDFDARTGPRDNKGLEAMALGDGSRTLWLGLEAPRTQDGALPTPDHGAMTRILKLDRATGKEEASYAYPLEPLAKAPAQGKVADGPGLDEIAAVDATHLLTMERSWVEGDTNYVQVYMVDTARASDVSGQTLLDDDAIEPVEKHLLVDLNALSIPMDNYEGLALGPKLADGRRLMLICSDNNFNKHQKTIVAAFAVDVDTTQQ